MMKKIYQKPKMITEFFEPEDVITSSPMGNGGKDDWGGDDGQDRDDFFQTPLDDTFQI